MRMNAGWFQASPTSIAFWRVVLALLKATASTMDVIQLPSQYPVPLFSYSTPFPRQLSQFTCAVQYIPWP